MSDIKISFLVRVIPPVIDGVGEYTWHLARVLREGGAEVRIFTSSEQTVRDENRDWVFPIIKEWSGRGVLESLQSQSTVPGEWFSFQYVPQLYGTSGICWGVTGIPAALKSKFKCRVSVTFHEIAAPWLASPSGIFLALWSRLQSRELLKRCDLAFTTCQRNARVVQALSQGRVPAAVIPVGSNIHPVPVSGDEISKLRLRYGINGEARVFGIFGRLTSERNYSTAIRLLHQSRQRGMKSFLLLMGRVESSDPKTFRSLLNLARKYQVEKQLIVTGELSPEDISRHFRLVDLFLFPQEAGVSTRNTVVMAAIAHGLPLVTYEPKEGHFEGDEIPGGFLARRGDEEGFIRKAMEVTNGRFVQDEGRKNQFYYEKYFAWGVLKEKFLKALELHSR